MPHVSTQSDTLTLLLSTDRSSLLALFTGSPNVLTQLIWKKRAGPLALVSHSSSPLCVASRGLILLVSIYYVIFLCFSLFVCLKVAICKKNRFLGFVLNSYKTGALGWRPTREQSQPRASSLSELEERLKNQLFSQISLHKQLSGDLPASPGLVGGSERLHSCLSVTELDDVLLLLRALNLAVRNVTAWDDYVYHYTSRGW